ncbi:hypothetical protein [Polynucleobacter sp. UK-Kesae-W10]|uniref:hypothetical protein n=1 Tax=Polynucleobacter sp. UK-Kesae-W10 TaxID=1819738 RepID=UPI001C0C3528|nr:hypothetical protein [Polynucleobacter sp. UK-Kesae-W10]MBU3577542.1 hypothetical protein [Polynucleobacter sp. UK-Kesae-W10]
MNDLNQINANNNKAILASIPKHLAEGKIVVAEYAGLSFVGFETFSGEHAATEAQEKLDRLNAAGGSIHGKIFTPSTEEASA